MSAVRNLKDQTIVEFDKHTFKTNDGKCDVYGWKNLDKLFIETIDSETETYSKYPLIINGNNKSNYQIEKETLIPFKKMNTIFLSGIECVLSEVHTSSSSYSYPQVCVKGCPVASIEFIDNDIQNKSFKRAEIIVDSFISYNHKLCFIPDSLLTIIVPFSIDLINSFTSIETYYIFGKKHLIIEGFDNNNVWFKFAIFDRDACISVLQKHYKNKKNDSHKFWLEDFWQINL